MWQEQGLGSVVTGDVAHAGFYPVFRRAGILLSRVFTRPARIPHQNYGTEKIALFWRVIPVQNATHDLWVCAGIDGRPER